MSYGSYLWNWSQIGLMLAIELTKCLSFSYWQNVSDSNWRTVGLMNCIWDSSWRRNFGLKRVFHFRTETKRKTADVFRCVIIKPVNVFPVTSPAMELPLQNVRNPAKANLKMGANTFTIPVDEVHLKYQFTNSGTRNCGITDFGQNKMATRKGRLSSQIRLNLGNLDMGHSNEIYS